MTIDEIIQEAADMCNIELGSSETDKRYGRLKAAVEYGAVQAAKVFKPIKTETVTAVAGLVNFSDFTMGVVEVLAIKRDGKRMKWAEREDGFYIGPYDGSVTVDYVPCPLTLSATDEPPIADRRFQHRNYAYFAAAEFMTGEGRHTDARAYQARWENGLYQWAGRRRMPFRRWI